MTIQPPLPPWADETPELQKATTGWHKWHEVSQFPDLCRRCSEQADEGTLKCIFLDVDGCLNRWVSGPLSPLHDDLVQRYNAIVTECAPIYTILSSSWRKYNDLKRELRKHIVIHDQTETFTSGPRQRGLEITAYLQRNKQYGKYLILDDEDEFFDDQSFLHINGDTGITEENAVQIARHFSNQKEGSA